MTKEQMLEATRTLPEDATIHDAIERLHLIEVIKARIAAANNGEKVSHEEARQSFAKWLK
jgi:sulfur carrier protein ThiS